MKYKDKILKIVTILLSLIAAITMYLNYDNMIAASKKEDLKNMDLTNVLDETIVESSLVIANQLQGNTDINAMFNTFIENAEQYPEDTRININQRFLSWQRTVKNNSNLKYVATNTKTNATVDNTDDDLTTIKSNDALNKKYQWSLTLHFNEAGEVSFMGDDAKIWNSLFSDALINLNAALSDYSYYYLDNTISSGVNLLTPKNVTITFAVPKTLETSGLLYYQLQSISQNHLEQAVIPFGMFASCIIFFIALFIPIEIISNQSPYKEFLNIKFGILAIALGFGSGLLVIGIVDLMYSSVNGDIANLLTRLNIENIGEICIALLHIGMWFLFFTIITLAAFSLKLLFTKGLSRYIKENTCIGWLWLHGKQLLNRVLTFDLSDNTNRTIFKIVIVNFVIITVISFFFVFGFFFAIIYSIILFVILKNKIIDIKKDYTSLLDATKQLSNGNFDIDISNDLGLFNSLKEEFSNIKDGFEKAVNEEVKSQKMKTELISNVSHDLKTPLTSIITYVDLLKNEEVNEEQRKQYLETIDRNSLRLKNLIEDLFEVSKVNSGNIQLDTVDVDVISMLQQVLFECEDKITDAMLQFKIQYSNEKMICLLDSSKTYRIFENLIINICKYALSNTRVYIQAIEYEDSIEITFKNISANEITFSSEDIVERFVQGDTSRNSGGSGLGLAIAKSFTEVQGGKFKIDVDGDLFKSTVIFMK